MKKFLIASTALTLSAGVAAADVTFSGDARFGVNYNSNPLVATSNVAANADGNKTTLEKRFTLNIDASTTADNGVTFGVRQRIRNEEPTATGPRTSVLNGTRLFARYQGFEVAVGNILGAIESMPNQYSRGVSLTGLSWGSVVTAVDRDGDLSAGTGRWDAYSSSSAGAEGVEVLYSAGDFKGHVSYSTASLNNTAGDAERLAAYGAYNYNGWTTALGFQQSDDARENVENAIVLSVDGKIQDFGVGFAAARLGKGADKMNKFVLNGSYTMGATTLGAYVGQQSELPVAATGNTKGVSKTSYGLGASYNLGGGASVVGGIERTTQKTTRADLGVSFRF